jgi:hypothetical protein
MVQETISNFESLSEKELIKYAGKWIAIIDGKVVESDESFKELYNSVTEKYKNKRPLFGKVPELAPTVLSID